jgi:hypothetical protein
LIGVGWGWLAATLPTNPNQLSALELACHSEHREESHLYLTDTLKIIIFQFYKIAE